jgi:hypothetical protein
MNRIANGREGSIDGSLECELGKNSRFSMMFHTKRIDNAEAGEYNFPGAI